MKVKLSRKRDYRNIMLRNLLTSLILHETIQTTHAKAKPLKVAVNNLINKVKTKDLQAKRTAKSILLDNNAYKKLFEDILDRLEDGTDVASLIKLNNRLGDNAPMAMISLRLKPITKASVTVRETGKAKIEEVKDEDKK